MSVIAVNKFTLDLEHKPGVLEAYRADPAAVLDGYRLSDAERDAIARLDADWFLTAGVNPIVIRNLLVILGIPHNQMYTHDQS
ncbi:hypothetical protein [Herbiconiux ginsengi]|uniref:Aromatic-ring-opening dioxygenase LigAB, LigA subunit n=1 Tax=Herbiconiux ginsengi TaxID=381665 RepID=A0A1H3MQP7_9MICO|nr:hypothetical protein [Herbiconiux ginsengi]SDY78830.1 Aromatic-ring-opening dioxygenase LigAB, LigA subunit [Herbiconiux ginsengi]